MTNTKTLQVFRDCQDQKVSIFKAIEVIEPQLIELIRDLQQIPTIIEFDELYNESILIINDYIKNHTVSTSRNYMYRCYAYLYSYLLKYVINNGTPFKLSLSQCKHIVTQNNIVLKYDTLLPRCLKENTHNILQDAIVSLSSQVNVTSNNIRDIVFDDVVDYNELCSILDRVLNTLTEREHNVLILRYGLNDGNAHTYSEIGNILNMHRSQCWAINNKAIRKMRHPSRSKKIKDWY